MKLRTLIVATPLILMGCIKSPGTQQTGQIADVQQCGPSCAKGNEQGNASDYFSSGDGSAWFVGENKEIRYCVETSSTFGVSSDFAKKSVEEAFDRWKQYIEKKQVYKGSKPENKVTVNRRFLPSCDGTEDIAFYFGLKNDEAKLYQTQIEGRVATAVRTKYDLKNAWGKGFVWVTPQDSISVEYQESGEKYPDWTKTYNLSGILTHELGHVYGVEHIDGTIMRKDVANFLRSRTGEERVFLLGAIDSYKELVICESCEMNYVGQIGYYSTLSSASGVTVDDSVSEAFEAVTGVKPDGGPTAVKGKLMGDIQSGLRLEVSDNAKSFSFPLGLDVKNKSAYYDNAEVFKVVRGIDGGGSSISTVPHGGYSINGTLVSQAGVTLNIELERNIYLAGPFSFFSGPLIIKYTANGKVKPLFMVDAKELNKP